MTQPTVKIMIAVSFGQIGEPTAARAALNTMVASTTRLD